MFVDTSQSSCAVGWGDFQARHCWAPDTAEPHEASAVVVSDAELAANIQRFFIRLLLAGDSPNPGKSHRDRVSVQDDGMTAPDRPAPGRIYLWCNHASVCGLFRDDAF